MKASVVAVAAALALVTGTARADSGSVLGFSVAPIATPTHMSLPSAATPNAPGSISVPAGFTAPPAVTQHLSMQELVRLWQSAGAAYGVPWQVLAAINKVESNFGENMGPSSAGAIGWMQFMPDTWLRWGVDANGDGVADPWNPVDAVYSAARYLAAAGGQSDIASAVYSYNHASWYVEEVLQLAQVYGDSGTAEPAQLQKLQKALDAARRTVVRANRLLVIREQHVRAMERVSRRLRSGVEHARLLSDRLVAQRRAVLYDARISGAQAAATAARSSLKDAQSKLAEAQRNAAAPSFAPGVSAILSGPSYGNGYVFPVGGGPGLVSAAHTHHDYPAVDIAAPEGSPVYALASSIVLNAWQQPDPRCGIGLTLRADDGQVWTYCHLAYLAASVVDGVHLAAGQQIGLVGETGDATGPHLHLQLQPPTQWPQQEAWFQSFAGRAFRWQDAPTVYDSSTTDDSPTTFEPEPSSGAVRMFQRVDSSPAPATAPDSAATGPVIGFTP